MNQININWTDKKPARGCALAVAGLPGVGHVGKLVVDHLVRTLKAKKIAEITSTLFPPQMLSLIHI